MAAVATTELGSQSGSDAVARSSAVTSALGAVSWVAVVLAAVVFDTRTVAVFAAPKYLVVGVSAVVLLTLSAEAVRRGMTLRWIWWMDGPVAVWVLANVAAYLASPARDLSLHGEALQRQGLIATLAYVVVFYAVRLAGSRTTVPLAAAVAGALVGAYGALQWFGLDPVWSELANGRVFSSIGQPNAFGAYMVVCLPFAVALAVGARGWTRVLGWVGAPLMFAGVWLSFSRGAYLAAAVAALVAVTAAAVAGRIRPRAAAGAVLVAVVLVGALWVVPITRSTTGNVIARGGSIAQPLDASNSRRLDLWTVGVAMATQNFWLGVGQERYAQAFSEYAATSLSDDSLAALSPFRPESPHNLYVAAAAGAGVPAALAYLAIVGAALALAWSRVTRRFNAVGLAVLFALVAHSIANAFITAELAGSLLFWALIGWLVAQHQESTKSPTPEVAR